MNNYKTTSIFFALLLCVSSGAQAHILSIFSPFATKENLKTGAIGISLLFNVLLVKSLYDKSKLNSISNMNDQIIKAKFNDLLEQILNLSTDNAACSQAPSQAQCEELLKKTVENFKKTFKLQSYEKDGRVAFGLHCISDNDTIREAQTFYVSRSNSAVHFE